MNKDLIQARFGKRLKNYNQNAKIQKIMSDKLISLNQDILDKEFNSVLEIGCGAGLFTKNILKQLKFNKYTAIDIVPECGDYIKQINESILFEQYDAEEYIKICPKFDIILSNASLQWIENLPKFINDMRSKLNKSGIIIFSVFGKENFKEISTITGTTLNYYSKNEWDEILKNYPHKIEEDNIKLKFNTPKDVLKHIQNTGVNSIKTKAWTKKDLADFEKKYNDLCQNAPILTYNPIYIKIG